MKPIIHLIADYGVGDPAFAEVIQKLKYYAPQAEVIPTSVPPLSTLATGFWIAQLGLYNTLPNTLIYANTAPRVDNQAPRQHNDGEPLVYVKLTNGVRIISPFSGYSFSFVKESIRKLIRILIPTGGSQFRSRDIFPQVVKKLINRSSILGKTLDPSIIPDIPADRIAFIDGYGNIKTTIRKSDWYRRFQAAPIRIRIGLNGIRKRALVATGIFSVPSGSLVIAAGSSGGSDPFLEIACRGGSAAKLFGYPPVESAIVFDI